MKIKIISIDYMTHKELKQLQKEKKFKRMGSVIQYLLNNYKMERSFK